MTKSEFAILLREHAKNWLAPTKEEQNLVTTIYESFKSALGANCILTGSYARFTSIRPLHDLDILYIAGKYDPKDFNPLSTLSDLEHALRTRFNNPTTWRARLSSQTHSITVSFLEGSEEKFAVDIVPALISGSTNEYGEDIYFVPEIVKVSRRKRQSLYAEFSKHKKTEAEWWIKSDPRGYIRMARDLNKNNNDFRKAIKIVKKWKHNCKELNENFGLKSFHIEQVLTRYFLENPSLSIFDAVFRCFCEIPKLIVAPQILDRADKNKMIDAYVGDLSAAEKALIIQARDCLLIKLENFNSSSSIKSLLDACFYERASATERFLYDDNIPILLEPSLNFKIDGYVKPLRGYSAGWLKDTPQLMRGLTCGDGKTRYIEFSIVSGEDKMGADLYKWKVRNDDACQERRGEITDHHTKNVPESTKYLGDHFVECYAIRDNVCIARARQNVHIR